jgi:DNA-binding LytR/AlgR family response regulator
MTFFFEQSPEMPTELLNHPPLRLPVSKAGHQLFPVADLIYLEAQVNYSQLYWLDERTLVLARPLKYHHAKLPQNWFIRIHRNYIVNRLFIKQLASDENGYWIHLVNGVSLPVARRRWREVCQLLIGDTTGRSRSIQASFYRS